MKKLDGMESLANLEAFARSAETGSFSAAARRLSLTPAAVSRNVATLERNLGTRLFHRSTRKLTLTEAGDAFLAGMGGSLEALQNAIADAARTQGQAAGVLKVSMSPSFGIQYVLPILPEFLARFPGVRPDWHFDSRRVDLVADGFDAAIGGGIPLSAGTVALTLGPAHIVAVSSPGYLAGRKSPERPADLESLDGIVMRSSNSGRVGHWAMRNGSGEEENALLREAVVMSDPAPMCDAALRGLGIALLAVPDVLHHLESGALVRVLPDWFADAGSIYLYHRGRTHQPLKVRVFIDFLTDRFRSERFAERFRADLA
ncbi:LysR family transcriptional regulator [Sphingomonas sp. DT-51]|uniref:LysR family transcriptional regulator n=1 Tax=Sphingomonas sp. DT-51 TaxID=3396165 RepID=UPI003F1CDBE9